MSLIQFSLFRKLWFRWKSLRLPWRKKFLVGLDLRGNSFWEFRDSYSSHQHRMRRIVKFTRLVHNSDVEISPQWHQWLRHTRADAPSLTELGQDLVRQENLKTLAAAADARWANAAKLLDKPEPSQYQSSIYSKHRNNIDHPDSTSGVDMCHIRDNISKDVGLARVQLSSLTTMGNHKADEETSPYSKSSDSTMKTPFPEDPWKKFPALASSTGEWQPDSWDPSEASSTFKSNITRDDFKSYKNDTK